MPLTNCDDCDRQISSRAKVCPHCGAPMRRDWMGRATTKGLAVLVGSGLLLVAFMVGRHTAPGPEMVGRYTSSGPESESTSGVVINRILEDLAAVLAPRAMTVTGEFAPRGGLHTTVTAEYSGRRGRAKKPARDGGGSGSTVR